MFIEIIYQNTQGKLQRYFLRLNFCFVCFSNFQMFFFKKKRNSDKYSIFQLKKDKFALIFFSINRFILLSNQWEDAAYIFLIAKTKIEDGSSTVGNWT